MTVVKKYYSDSGHAWVAVKRKELEELDLLDSISPYSYQKGQTVYLEEDCDAAIYLNQCKAFGIEVDLRTVYHEGRSPIRNYEGFYND